MSQTLTTEKLDGNLPDISWIPDCRKDLGGLLVEEDSEPPLVFGTCRLRDCPVEGMQVETPFGEATIECIISHPQGYWLLDLRFEQPVHSFYFKGTAPDYDGIRVLDHREANRMVQRVTQKELRWMLETDIDEAII